MRLNAIANVATPVVNTPMLTLESASSTQITLTSEVTVGGEVTSSTAMRTRFRRDAATGVGGRTSASIQRLDQTTNTAGNAAFASTSYATTAPTNLAGALKSFSWNANGGYIRWLAAPGEEFVLSVAASMSFNPDLGTAQSTYEITWSEF